MIRVWDSQTGHLERELSGHVGPVYCLALATGQLQPLLVSGGHDRSVRLFNPLNGDPLGILLGHSHPVRAVAVTTVPHLLVVSGGLDNTTRIWDLDNAADEELRQVSEIIGVADRPARPSLESKSSKF